MKKLYEQYFDSINSSGQKKNAERDLAVLEAYEDKLQKPIYEFTTEDFIRIFEEVCWTQQTTFLNKRNIVATFLLWLSEQGYPADPTRVKRITRLDVDDTNRISTYFKTADDLAEALSSICPSKDESYPRYAREQIVIVLSTIGLTLEEIVDLKRSDVSFERNEIKSGSITYRDINESVLDVLFSAFQKKGYTTDRRREVFGDNEYAVPKANGKSERTILYIRNLRDAGTRVMRSSIAGTPIDGKSVKASDLHRSYLFIYMKRMEQQTGNSITHDASTETRQLANDMKAHLDGRPIEKPAQLRGFVRDYLLWKSYSIGDT